MLRTHALRAALGRHAGQTAVGRVHQADGHLAGLVVAHHVLVHGLALGRVVHGQQQGPHRQGRRVPCGHRKRRAFSKQQKKDPQVERRPHVVAASMHVALVFFGLIRHGHTTYPSVQKNVLEVLQQHHVTWDSFCHTYNLPVITNSRSQEQNAPIEGAATFAACLGNTAFRVDNQEVTVDAQLEMAPYMQHGDPWHDQWQSLRNLLRQLHV